MLTCGETVGNFIRWLDDKHPKPETDKRYQAARDKLVEELLTRGANKALLAELLDEAKAGNLNNLGGKFPSLKHFKVIKDFHAIWRALSPEQRKQYGDIEPRANKGYTLNIILLRLFKEVDIELTTAQKKQANSKGIHPCVELNSGYIDKIILESAAKLGSVTPNFEGLQSKLQQGLVQRKQSVGYGAKGMQTLAQSMWPLMEITKSEIKNYLPFLFPETGYFQEIIAWFMEELNKRSNRSISWIVDACKANGIIKQGDTRWLKQAMKTNNYHLVYSVVASLNVTLLWGYMRVSAKVSGYQWLTSCSEMQCHTLLYNSLIEHPDNFLRKDHAGRHFGHYLAEKGYDSLLLLLIKQNDTGPWFDFQGDVDQQTMLLHRLTGSDSRFV